MTESAGGPSVSILGVRHHGPGSARSVVRALERLAPDVVLVEGPPDAQPVLHLAALPAMRPPVALVVFPPEQPGRGAFYPFASFSPEWNAIRYALERSIAVRFCDLPQAFMLAEEHAATEEALREDPIRLLAQAAGEDDPERWWERLVEQRADEADVFAAVAEAMAAVRDALAPPAPAEARREAHMRQAIREARRQGHQRIAVVCGAWHAPALAHMPAASADAALLRGLKRIKTEATWIPWTASRLAYASGYGAGVESPAWYRHLWETHGDLEAWLSSAARLLRAEDLDASPAQVVESVRLCEALASLRHRPRPSLSEVTDATLAVLCQGDEAKLALIRQRLIVGEEMGALPAEVPAVPLQRDLEAQARRLRLRFEPEERVLDLDLRQPAHLEQSRLLHRLSLLGIAWGERQPLPGGRLGTFHERWSLRWRPELALSVIEAGVYGNTVEAAASARAIERGQQATDLGTLAGLVEVVLLAALDQTVPALVALLGARSAESTDVGQMLRALGPLAASLRYGDVRQTDASALGPVVRVLVERAVAGLPAAATGLDDEAAQALAEDLDAASRAVRSLDAEADGLHDDWWRVLRRLADSPGAAPLVAGLACRLLLDAERLDADAVAERLARALARGVEPAAGAHWLEGLLRGAGQVLVSSARLFGVLDAWLSGLPGDYFEQVLPLLRRTTATFSTGERRQIAERVRGGGGRTVGLAADDDLDAQRAALVEPLLRQILGLRS